MALVATHNDVSFGVGDRVKVTQRIKEGEKERTQVFEGMVIAIKGRDMGKSFTVRRIGVQKIGIERIFPLNSPQLEKIEISKRGKEGIKHAKLYYIRNKSRKEVDQIYMKASHKINNTTKKVSAKKKEDKKVIKSPVKKEVKKK